MAHITYNIATGERTVTPLTAEEIAQAEPKDRAIRFEYLRQKRDQLLAETDYLALADVTLTDEMRAYRQALRDLPANTADPANPVWPTKPGGTN